MVVGCSRLAREQGIESGAMLSDLTPKQRKGLLIIPQNSGYEDRLLDDFSMIVEGFSPEHETWASGECIINVAGVPSLGAFSVRDLAAKIGQDLSERTGAKEVLIGVSQMKTLARALAYSATSDVPQCCPDGREVDWLLKTDLADLPGLDLRFISKITAQGFRKLEHVRLLHKRDIMKRFGRELGEWLYMLTLGYDLPYAPKKEEVFEFEKILKEDINNNLLLREHLFEVADRVMFDLQQVGKIAKSLRITLGYSDGRFTEGTFRVDPPTDLIEEMGGQLYECFIKAYTRRVALRTICISCYQSVLPKAHAQYTLLSDSNTVHADRKKAINKIRTDFGFDALSKGTYLRVTTNEKERPAHFGNSTRYVR